MNRFWLRVILFCLHRLGFPYLERDASGEWVEAITASNSEKYIDAVANIEVQ